MTEKGLIHEFIAKSDLNRVHVKLLHKIYHLLENPEGVEKIRSEIEDILKINQSEKERKFEKDRKSLMRFVEKNPETINEFLKLKKFLPRKKGMVFEKMEMKKLSIEQMTIFENEKKD